VGKRGKNLTYEVHGDGVASLERGFDELRMPANRRREAIAIVGEVLAANDGGDFAWYKARKDELCCYWGDPDRNLLWITAGAVHMLPTLPRPDRPLTYSKEDGNVGWLLPGAEKGTGGGSKQREVATVLCPESGIRQPAGQLCAECEIIH
jgi:hypothetical protein